MVQMWRLEVVLKIKIVVYGSDVVAGSGIKDTLES